MDFTINNPNTQYLSKCSLTPGELPYSSGDLDSALKKAVEAGTITVMDQLLISQYYWAKQTYQQKKDAVIKSIEMDEYNPSKSVSPDALRLYKKQITVEAAKFLHMSSVSAVKLVVNQTILMGGYWDDKPVILDKELIECRGEIQHDNPKAELLKKGNYRLKVVL